MAHQLAIIFTATSGVCLILLMAMFIHFLLRVHKKYEKTKAIDPLVKTCATISLCGYTIFVLISFILDLISSLWYIPSINIQYTKILCQLQTFNIAFFMMGKLAMYFFFLSLVHVAFRDSFLAYSTKLIGGLAFGFFGIMCVIGGFYIVCLFMDFQAVDSITSPDDCQQFKASDYTTIIIWTGATFDAIWSFTCLILFYLRLRKITTIMLKQASQSRLEIAKMEERCSRESMTKDSSIPIEQTLNGAVSQKTASDEIMKLQSDNVAGTNKISKVKSLSQGDVVNLKFKDVDSMLPDIDDEEVTKTATDDYTAKIAGYKQQRYKYRKIKRRISIGTRKRKQRKPDIVHKFLPIMLKLSILSAWCALSTAMLGFGLWTIYPTLSSVIDCTINGICVYLSFGFANKLYQILCLPFISCRNCDKCMIVVKEANQMEKEGVYNEEKNVLG